MKKKLLMAVVASVLSFSNVDASNTTLPMGGSQTAKVAVTMYLVAESVEHSMDYKVIDHMLVCSNGVFRDGKREDNTEITPAMDYRQIGDWLMRRYNCSVLMNTVDVLIPVDMLENPYYYAAVLKSCAESANFRVD